MTGPRRVLLRAVLATSPSATLVGVVGAGGANADTSASTGGLDGAIEAALSAHELTPRAPRPRWSLRRRWCSRPARQEPDLDSASLALRSLLASRPEHLPRAAARRRRGRVRGQSACRPTAGDRVAAAPTAANAGRCSAACTQVGRALPLQHVETPAVVRLLGFVVVGLGQVGVALPHQSRSINNGVHAVTLETVQPATSCTTRAT